MNTDRHENPGSGLNKKLWFSQYEISAWEDNVTAEQGIYLLPRNCIFMMVKMVKFMLYIFSNNENNLKVQDKLSTMVQTCNPTSGEAEAGGSCVGVSCNYRE